MVKCRIWAIAVLIAFMTVMSVGTVAAAPFSDVEGADCEEAVTVLYTLDLLEGKTDDMFAPYVNMTRAELATVIMRFMNLERATGSGTVFSDVADYHWASGNIEAAYGMGIIAGMGDGTFAPDANVTYAQAIKMFVSALGYSVHAEASGGYPSGYMSKAAQLGMLKGVSVSGADTFITRSDMAVIMYNMLEIDLLVETSFGAGASGGYAEAEDKTLLSEYRGIYIEEGIVTADYYTAIETSESNISKGEVAIDGVRFTAGETEAEALLGYKVKAYYEIPDGSETPALLYIAPVSGTETITLSAADVSEDTTETSIEYTDAEGKEKTFAVDSDATLVLNGAVKAEWTKEDLKPALGTVTAVNNRGSEDIIFVDAYTNYIVNSKNVNTDTIYFKEGDPLVLDLKDTSKRIYLANARGEEIGLDALSEWHVLSVAKGGNVIKAINSNTKVSGKVAEVDAEEVVIGETKYAIDPNLPNGSLAAPELNMTASFCLDFMGNIAAVDKESVSLEYGYLVGAAYKKGIGGIAQFKIFTEDGQMIFLDAADKVIVNGVSCSADEVLDYIPKRSVWGAPTGVAVAGAVRKYSVAEETIRQLIRYTVTEDNTKIKEIETATDATTNPIETAGNAGFNMVVELSETGTPMTYIDDETTTEKKSVYATTVWNGQYAYRDGSMCSFAGKYGVGGSTVMFFIPEDGAPDEEYKINPAPVLHDVFPGASFYDMSETYVLGAIVWDQGAAKKMGASVSNNKQPYASYPIQNIDKAYYGIFLGTTKAVNEEGEPVVKVRMLRYDKQEVTVMIPDEYFRFGTWVANTDLTINPETGKPVDKDLASLVGQTRTNAAPTKNHFIDVSQLKYGDVIQYSYNLDLTEFAKASVVMRTSTPGMYEVGTLGDRWGLTTNDIFYTGGDLASSGTILKADPNALILKSNIATAQGAKGDEVIRTMSTTTAQGVLVIAIDLKENAYEIISYDEVLEGETYAMVWTTIWPRFFIVYR